MCDEMMFLCGLQLMKQGKSKALIRDSRAAHESVQSGSRD